jgi:hypothetical protein
MLCRPAPEASRRAPLFIVGRGAVGIGAMTPTPMTALPDEVLQTDVLGRVRTKRSRREALLNEFERGGASARAFAAMTGIKYQTFASWVQKRRRARRESIPPPPRSKRCRRRPPLHRQRCGWWRRLSNTTEIKRPSRVAARACAFNCLAGRVWKCAMPGRHPSPPSCSRH